MPISAFSKSLQDELDVHQYLAKINIPDSKLNEFVRADVVCPICQATGAGIVNGKVKQSYFRFLNKEGKTSHHVACDYYTEDGSSVIKNENQVNFMKPRTDLTRMLRTLVCAGLQIGVFDQKKMHEMRRWFFESRRDSLFEIKIELSEIERIKKVTDKPIFWDSVPFHPSHASLPGYDWVRGVTMEYNSENIPLRRRLLENKIHISLIAPIHAFLSKNERRFIIDPSILQDKYETTVRLSKLILSISPQISNKTRNKVVYNVSSESFFNAFSALLLFISDWNFEKAVEIFVEISRVENLIDENAGNFIGFDPFYKYEVYAALKKLSELAPWEISDKEICDIEVEMRKKFSDWLLSHPDIAYDISERDKVRALHHPGTPPVGDRDLDLF
ncbi:hypothetical protein [Rahnella aceris]